MAKCDSTTSRRELLSGCMIVPLTAGCERRAIMGRAGLAFSALGSGQEDWAKALAALRDADTRFDPIQKAFSAAERAYFALCRERECDPAELDGTPEKLCLDQATADEAFYGNVLNDAANILYGTPSPDLAALITKVEFVQTIGYEGDSETMILKDLRQLNDRLRSTC